MRGGGGSRRRGAPRGGPRGGSRGGPRGAPRGFRGAPRGSMNYHGESYQFKPSTFIPSKDSEMRMYKVSLCKWIKEGKDCRNEGE